MINSEADLPVPVGASATVAPRVLERIEEFDSCGGNMSTYLKRLELYFEANSVEPQRKVALLLMMVGTKVYETLRGLLAPDAP